MTSDNDLQRAALIGKIAAGLAHDINGPVGVIIGFADLARETLARTADGSVDAAAVKRTLEYLDMISDAAVRARSLTRGVWVFARNRPGTVGAVDVTRVVRLAAALAMPELRGARIETPATEADLVPPEAGAEVLGPVAHGDFALCAEALVALFLSAPHALPAGGTLSWNVFEDGDTLHLELAGEPYEDPSAIKDWPAPESARCAFEQQGGRLVQPGGAKVIGLLPLAGSVAMKGSQRSPKERGRPLPGRPRG